MAGKIIERLRDFPAVEQLVQSPALADAVSALPRPVAVDVIREVIAEQKKRFRKEKDGIATSALDRALIAALHARAAGITRVINATGIIVHTNLGRAPLSPTLFDQIKNTVTGYGNIEFDLRTGKRGGRGAACEDYLVTLSGAEAGTVVNNNAAALFVILNTLANRKKVVISRGELVQIGGGFRIPDILIRSGARLSEVGTTNITSLSDYESALDDRTGLILKVHKSNFVQAGFTDEVDLKPLVALGRKHGIPVVNDLGSGVFSDTRSVLGYHEPTVQESVRAGAEITCFSGDKMLGGMQSGLIVGRKDLIAKIKKNPIFRTVRADKVVFSILEKLLTSYLNGTEQADIKLWQLLARPLGDLKRMAEGILEKAGRPTGVSIEPASAYVGGGAMPEQAIKSIALAFSAEQKPERLMKAFRDGSPPVIGRVEQDRFLLDLKAVDETDIDILARAVKKQLA
jgi:L-seryl-tRNA(Ser) seleniumtransferase